jgi:tight adherence protein C
MTPKVILISALVGIAVMCFGGALVLLRNARRERDLARSRARADYDVAPAKSEPARGLQRALVGLGQRVTAGGTSADVRRDLAAAGYHAANAAEVFIGAKLACFVLGLAVFGFLLLRAEWSFPVTLFVILFGSTALFFLPNLWLGLRRDRRRSEIRRHLPDSIDLLEICVSSGMGLDMAWNSVADEMRPVSATFADEMELCNLETTLGVPRNEAMKHMAERTGAEDISSLVALLIQSDRFGASIVDALRNFGQALREAHGQRAGEAAEKMSVKLLFPLVLFIFPALLVVMLGPALLEMASAFRS